MVRRTSKFSILISCIKTKLLFFFFYFPRLYNPNFHGVYAPAIGGGTVGLGGQVTFPQVCQFLSNGATRDFDDESRVPYAYQKRTWISYDDEESLEEKVPLL